MKHRDSLAKLSSAGGCARDGKIHLAHGAFATVLMHIIVLGPGDIAAG
jgi:hypothetical protein